MANTKQTKAVDAWGDPLSTCQHVRDPKRGGVCYACYPKTGRPS